MLALARARSGSAPAPWILVGIDGAERKALETLWQRGEPPNLRQLARCGNLAPTPATEPHGILAGDPRRRSRPGVSLQRDGITDFVVATPSGDVPVSLGGALRAGALGDAVARAAAGRRLRLVGDLARAGDRRPDGDRPRSTLLTRPTASILLARS